MPIRPALSTDDIGGLLLSSAYLLCGDSIAEIMIGRFQFSYVISQVSSLYRLMRKNATSPQPLLTYGSPVISSP
ncbi:hypothetical protein DKM19_09110 [Streptosporangium sp. 'caverna']|nr:hypothetical protein DKM19_09110 [Streptosporangium sp. 'caverna']